MAVSLAALALAASCPPPAHAFFGFGKKAEPKKPVVSAPAPGSLTLRSAFEKALVRSESLAIEKEDLELAQARFYRSFQYFLPTVSFRTTRFERDVGKDSSSSEGGISSDSRRRVTPEEKFVFSQPIFSGFKEYAALAGSGADKKQQRLEYRRAEDLLFVDVMEAFYATLQAEADLKTLRTVADVLGKRMAELKERVNLGRSRESEMKTAEADLRIIEADLVTAEASARISLQLLEFYVGESLEGRGLADEDVPADTGDLAFHLNAAGKRADVLATEEALKLARQGVVSAQSGFFPKAYLDGNYYTRRVGFQNGTDWDILLSLDVPIFDAGQTLGDVKEAWSTRKSAEYALSRARRTAELEIRNAHEDLTAARRATTAYNAAHEASKTNFEILEDEYRHNLVNNLDVLDALRRFEDEERRWHEARFDEKRAYWKFRSAIGEIL